MKATRHLIVAAIMIAVAIALMSSVFAGDDGHAAVDGDVFTIVQNGVEITYELSVPGDGPEYVIVTGAVETDEESTSYSLVIPATVRYDETDYDVKMVGYDAFYGCSSLTSITIPSSVEYLGDSHSMAALL